MISAAYTGEALDVCVCEALVQELFVGSVFAIRMFGSRVSVHVDMIRLL